MQIIKVIKLEESFRKFLETSRDWDRTQTKTPGVFIRRMPGSKRKPPTLALELNPPDSRGKPTKKSGCLIRNEEDLTFYRDTFPLKNLDDILKILKKVNPNAENSISKIDI